MSQPNATDGTAPSSEATTWQLEFARLIAFPAESALGVRQNWWEELAGGRPDDYTLTQSKGSHEERGTFQDVRLSLRIDHHRIEWLVEPLGKLDESDGSLPIIGPFHDTIPRFAQLMTSWLAKPALPLFRLAFVCKLLQPSNTQEEIYRVLERLLHYVKLTPWPNDFLYHVNRRRESRVVDGLGINRMSTWSKMNVLFAVEPGKAFTWPKKGYSAVQLDINTAPEKGEILPADFVSPLLEELVRFGLEIAEQGDVV